MLDDRAEALRNCLDRLKSKQRNLIIRYYQRRNTVAELAKLLNMATRTIYRQVDLIRLALLDCVMRQGRSGSVE